MTSNNTSQLPQELAEPLQRFDKSFRNVEEMLAKLLKRPFREVLAGMGDLEAAKMDVVLAYVLNTLFYIYLRTRGSSVTKHPVKDEIGRVKAYFLKMKKVKAELQKAVDGAGARSDADGKEEASVDATAAATGAGPRLRVDRAAAERHVRGNLDGGANSNAGARDGGRGVKRSPAKGSHADSGSGKKKKKSRKKKRRTK